MRNVFLRLWPMLLAFVAPATQAATEFTAISRIESSGVRLPALGAVRIDGRVDGDVGRIEYVHSAVPTIRDGSIVATVDGGRSAKLYDVAEHECRDAPAPFGAAAAGAPSPLAYENVRVEQVLDERAGKRFDLAQRHLRHVVRYGLGQGASAAHGTITTDLWVAPALTDAAFALWLTKAPRTGNAATDARIAAGYDAIAGAPLKRVQRTVLERAGKPPQATTSMLEVTRLVRKTLPAAALAAPFECRTGASPR